MRLNTERTLAAAGGATGLALMLAACGDDADTPGVDDGVGADDVTNGEVAPEPDESEDNGAAGGGPDEDAPMIVLAGEEESFQMRCLSDPDVPGSLIIASVGTDTDALSGSFGFEDRADNLYVELDSGSWGVSDTLGEFLAFDLGADGEYVVGEAVFETQDGDTETGSINIVC